MKKDIAVIGLLVLIVLSGAVLFRNYADNGGVKVQGSEEGVVTLAIGESARFGALTIAPLELIEDSRCAIDMVCVWEGTVRVKLETVSGLGTSVQTLELGKSMTTEAEEISFLSVAPSRKESKPVPEGDYRFTFEVKKRSLSDTDPGLSGDNASTTQMAGCFIGGCSGQICSDQEGVASNCEYRADYACYKTAKCERQSNGQCGWTQTSELKMCLDNPPSL